MDSISLIVRITEDVKRLAGVRGVRGERGGWIGKIGRNFGAVKVFSVNYNGGYMSLSICQSKSNTRCEL